MFYSGERTKKEICANQPPSPLPFQKFSTFLFSSAGVTKRQEEEWREIDFAWGGKRGKSNSSSSLVSAVTAEEGLKVAEEGNKPIMYRTEGRERSHIPRRATNLSPSREGKLETVFAGVDGGKEKWLSALNSLFLSNSP